MRRVGPRINAALAAAALLLVLGACSDDNGDSSDKDDSVDGLLSASDMPFEKPQKGTLEKPDPLTQLSTSCVGIEQSVLYDADWTVEARKYFDDDQWSVTTAVFTPPSGTSDDDGLQQVRTKSEQCISDEPEATIEPIDLGADTYAYEVQDAQGGFDSARAYVVLEDGGLAQVSVQEMPSGKDATAVLKDLVDEVD